MRDLLGALRERLVGGCQPGEVVAHRGVDAFALEVAVVVEEEVDDELRVAHEHAQALHDQELLLAAAVGRLEDAEQDVREEDAWRE